MQKIGRLLSLSLVLTAATSLSAGEERALRERILSLETQVNELSEAVRALREELTRLREPPDADAAAVVALGGTEASPAQVLNKPARIPLAASWDAGIRLESPKSSNGDEPSVKLKFGGRIFNDWSGYVGASPLQSRVGPFRDGTEFRAARLYFEGDIDHHVKFKAEYDFAGGEPAIKDAYIGLVDLPVLGTLKVGHFKEPFGLEQLTSSRFITFMERSMGDLFAPGRNSGVLVENAAKEDRVHWSAGFFRDADDFGSGDDGTGGYAFTGRLTGLPWFQQGDRLLHVGVAYSHRSLQNGSLRLRQRMESHRAPRFLDTGLFTARSEDRLGFEGALVNGRFSAQGEYMAAFVDASGVGDPNFSGYYVQGSVFLTGDRRSYKPSSGAFDRVSPHSPFLNREGGKGAWEVALRYSRLDLSDRLVRAGEMDGFTLGLNWYLTRNTRFLWNYVFNEVRNEGETNVLQARFQLDF